MRARAKDISGQSCRLPRLHVVGDSELLDACKSVSPCLRTEGASGTSSQRLFVSLPMLDTTGPLGRGEEPGDSPCCRR
eukprot:scaffold49701_cov33-Tisochrysis_lutea.AAC.2